MEDSKHCQLKINGRIEEKVLEFNYLGVNIISSGNLITSIKTQALKAARVAVLIILSGKKEIYEEGNKIKNI